MTPATTSYFLYPNEPTTTNIMVYRSFHKYKAGLFRRNPYFLFFIPKRKRENMGDVIHEYIYSDKPTITNQCYDDTFTQK